MTLRHTWNSIISLIYAAYTSWDDLCKVLVSSLRRNTAFTPGKNFLITKSYILNQNVLTMHLNNFDCIIIVKFNNLKVKIINFSRTWKGDLNTFWNDTKFRQIENGYYHFSKNKVVVDSSMLWTYISLENYSKSFNWELSFPRTRLMKCD